MIVSMKPSTCKGCIFCLICLNTVVMNDSNSLRVNLRAATVQKVNSSSAVDEEKSPNPESTLLEFSRNKENSTELAAGDIKRRVVRVVGGMQSAANARWPWLAELLLTNRKNRHICGGTLISESHVLTAAHCFDRYNASEITIRLGEYDRSRHEGSERDYKIQSIVIHDRYDPTRYAGGIGKAYSSKDHDIALVTITSVTENNDIGLGAGICPLQLPGASDDFSEGDRCYVIGWGYTHYSNLLSDLFMPSDSLPGLPNIVHEAQIELLPRKTCRNHYYKRFTSRMICAGQQNGGRDTCDGDSGGPLACQSSNGRWKLWGITSWGDNRLCNPDSDKPGVYVKVSKYVKWIEKMIRRGS